MSQAKPNNSTKTVTQSLSRREAVSLSIGGALAITTGGVAAALASAPDPIFVAIEAHKTAYWHFLKAVDVSSKLRPTHSQYKQAMAASETASEAFENAAVDLTDVSPTTFAGVMALLSYVDDFNLGKWDDSDHFLWPDELTDEDVLDASDEHLSLPFPFWLMRNIHSALQRLGPHGLQT